MRISEVRHLQTFLMLWENWLWIFLSLHFLITFLHVICFLYRDPKKVWPHSWRTGNNIHLMYGPEGNSLFCFSESPDQDSRETKLCYIFRLSLQQSQQNKQTNNWEGNNCGIVSRSGYICIWSVARDQESTNHSARSVEWTSRYITICVIYLI